MRKRARRASGDYNFYRYADRFCKRVNGDYTYIFTEEENKVVYARFCKKLPVDIAKNILGMYGYRVDKLVTSYRPYTASSHDIFPLYSSIEWMKNEKYINDWEFVEFYPEKPTDVLTDVIVRGKIYPV